MSGMELCEPDGISTAQRDLSQGGADALAWVVATKEGRLPAQDNVRA